MARSAAARAVAARRASGSVASWTWRRRCWSFGVAQAEALLGQRAQGLRQQDQTGGLDRELAPAGGDDLALAPHDVAEVQVLDQVEPLPEDVRAEEQLQVARPVAQGRERQAPVPAEQDDPAGDPDGAARGGIGTEPAELVPDLGQRGRGVEAEGEGLHPAGAEPVDLVPAGGEGLGEPAALALLLSRGGLGDGRVLGLSHRRPRSARRSGAVPPA